MLFVHILFCFSLLLKLYMFNSSSFVIKIVAMLVRLSTTSSVLYRLSTSKNYFLASLACVLSVNQYDYQIKIAFTFQDTHMY